MSRLECQKTRHQLDLFRAGFVEASIHEQEVLKLHAVLVPVAEEVEEALGEDIVLLLATLRISLQAESRHFLLEMPRYW